MYHLALLRSCRTFVLYYVAVKKRYQINVMVNVMIKKLLQNLDKIDFGAYLYYKEF